MSLFTRIRALPRSVLALVSRTSPVVAFGVAVVSLLLAFGPTANAARIITGSDIKNGSIKSADIKDRTLRAADVKNGTLTGKDVRSNTLRSKDIRRNAVGSSEIRDGSVLLDDLSEAARPVPGPRGPAGPAGADGADGADGATGPAGPAGPTEVVFGSDYSTDVAATNSTASSGVPLPGAEVTLNLPRPGVIAVTFSAENRCITPLAGNRWCEVDLLVDGVLMDGEADDVFSSLTPNDQFGSTHSVTRTLAVPAGSHTITVRYGVTADSTWIGLDDWNLVAVAYLN